MTSPSSDLLAGLGVRRVINAAGTYTTLGGGRMPPEVIDAWAEAARINVRLTELGPAVGRRIAAALGADAALVTAGAAAALTVGTAACVAGSDPERIRRLPDTTGIPNEVVVQRSHRFAYDHAVRACGVRLIEVETEAEADAAIGPQTAMLLFLNLASERGAIRPDAFVGLARRQGLPTLIDCAADVPPADTIRRAIDTGFDLVAVSGGKAIGGPQNAGLLLGRADLVAAAYLNSAPNADVIGRGMKATKETLLAMLVAVERFVARDKAADRREWEDRVACLAHAVRGIPGVTPERYEPPIANRAPHLTVRWDPECIRATRREIHDRLRAGEPSIEPVPEFLGPDAWAANGPQEAHAVNFAVWTLAPGEAEIVADRLAAILEEASTP
jgi:L-seryl-tRNA(Ser) seleniumtransferase